MTAIWLDRITAVPSVSLTFKPWFRSREAFVSALEPVFLEWDAAGEGLVFKDLGPLGLRIEVSTGHTIDIDLTSVRLSFSPNADVVWDTSGRPQIQHPEVVVYTAALAAMTRRAAGVLSPLLQNRARPCTRAVIGADCLVPADAPPPGLASWLESLRKAWRGKELAVGGQSVTALGEAAGQKDRARHRVSWGGEKAAFELHVDWQRHYDPPSPLSVGDVKARLDEWSAIASGYFEHFGVDFDG